MEMVVPGRYDQLPDDVSDELKSMSDGYGMDAHSHNYLTLRELMDSKYYKMSIEELSDMGIDPYFFKTMVPDLQKFGKPEDIDIFVWIIMSENNRILIIGVDKDIQIIKEEFERLRFITTTWKKV